MFRVLGLHPAQDWDLYAAAALTATASLPQVRRALGELAQAHLIQPTAPGRYQMHDLLRSYAPAERHRRPHPPPVGTPVPDLGDLAAARAWLDAELATLTAVIAYTASSAWPSYATRLAVT